MRSFQPLFLFLCVFHVHNSPNSKVLAQNGGDNKGNGRAAKGNGRAPPNEAMAKILKEKQEVIRKRKAEIMKKQAGARGFLKKKKIDRNNRPASQLRRKDPFRRKKDDLASILFPGVSPEEFFDGEEIPMWVDLVESKKTQVPFQYYDLPTCQGPSMKKVAGLRKNLGAKLQGHNLKPSPYEIFGQVDQDCQALCMVKVGIKKLRWMRHLVDRQYRVHVSLDSLPVLMRSKELNYAVRGFPLGFKAPPSYTGLAKDEYYLYNHIKFSISYREDKDNFEGFRVVGFDAHPVSISHQSSTGDLKDLTSDTVLKTCMDGVIVKNDVSTFLPLTVSDTKDKDATLDIVYSYEVEWVASEKYWSDRWDIYMVGSPDDEIHYFSIVNSLMIVFFLMGAVATILLRTLKRDIAAYNDLQTVEDAQEESGWKLVHGDVFRPPQNLRMVLCVAVGTGCQLGLSVVLTILSGFFGFLSPMNKGQTLSSVIVLYVMSGSAAGYVSSRLYKLMDGKKWKRNTMLTATLFPGMLVAMFLSLNIFLSFAGAATAVSIWTILLLSLLWVCVSTPLVFLGSFFGFRAEKLSVPVKTNQIARVIPDTLWYLKPPYTFLLGGILPFGSVCIELFFIMSALWLHQIYYIVGFLWVVALILFTTCALVSIVTCYLQLCGEDHQWWWRSFLNCAGGGFYFFVYSLWFLSTKMNLVGILPTMVYLTYMSMLSIAFALFCGSVGFLSCLIFTRLIYGALKVD